MNRKLHLIVLFSILCILVLGAIPFASAQENVTLDLWIMPNGPEPAVAIEKQIAKFEEAHPGVDVVAEVIDWGSAYTRIVNAAVSGEGPDVTQLGTTWVGAIDALGALHHFSEEEVEAVGGLENYADAALNTVVRADDESGDVVALPWFIDVRAINYRTDIFEELDIDPETAFADWDSFTETLQTIKDAELTGVDAATGEEFAIAPIAFPGKNDWNVLHNFAPWVWSAGGDLLNEDQTGAAFTSEEALSGINYYASLYTQGFTPVDSLELNSAQVDGLFSGGRVAMVISGPWNVVNSRTSVDNNGWSDEELEGNLWPDNLGIAEIPAGPAGRYTFVGGSNLGVYNTSDNLDLAVELAQFLSANPESIIEYTQDIGMLPAYTPALEDEIFAEDEDFSQFISAIENGRSYPTIAVWGPLETVMVTNLGALWDDVAGVNGEFVPDEQIPARLEAAAQEVESTIEQSE